MCTFLDAQIQNSAVIVIPKPNRKPVINLIALVLSRSVKSCEKPSIIKGTIMINAKNNGNDVKINLKIIPINEPIKIPKHREQK